MTKFITSDAQFFALQKAGLFEDDASMIRRVVIDLEHGRPAKVYVERWADDEKLLAGLIAMLEVDAPE